MEKNLKNELKIYYYNIYSLEYETNCSAISSRKWEKLMEGSTRADTYKINKLVKEYLPDLFISLGFDLKPLKDLSWFNPYHYYKTKTHFILVHSSIEYFLKFYK